jgi:hypothetical protein
MVDTLAVDVARELIRIGWMKLVGDELHFERTGRLPAERLPSTPTRLPSHPVIGRNPRGAWKPLSLTVEINGGYKALVELTVEDVTALAIDYSAKAAGYARRAEWCERARRLMEVSKKETVARLNKEQLKKLAEMAKGAWS